MQNQRTIFLVCFLIVVIATSASGQFYFGKNKVQYTHFDWQVMETDHFRIYFYSDESEIAQMAAVLAEDAYEELSAKFNFEVRKLTPLIIYSSPSYFSQTNVIPGLLPESVAGFTEFLKGRVVVPFYGSHHDFAHVIKHEIVHVFTLARLSEAHRRHTRVKPHHPPLWFIEGLAEFWSEDWDAEGDMIARDMVLAGRLFSIPQMYRIRGSYFMYKLGESICHFIDSTYGSDKIVKIFDNWHKGRNFNDVIKVTLGDDLIELSKKWEYHLKKKYFPSMQNSGLPDMESRKVTAEGFSVKGVPIMWDDGSGEKEWIVFKANRRGYSGIYMTSADGSDKSVKTLLKGERSSNFEQLYLLRSGIDANDSGQIVFSSKSKERDVIYLYDLGSRGVVERFEFDNLIAARSPRLSPDGKRIVFTGMKTNGFADIYLLDIEDGSIKALTDDIYYDTGPTFTVDGSAVVFASDRNPDGRAGGTNLYQLDVTGGTPTRLTSGNYNDQSPECSQDGIYFSSDRQSGYNLFKLDKSGLLTRQSALATGAFNPRLSPDGERLIYTGYQNMQFQVYEMELEENPPTLAQPEITQTDPWLPRELDRRFEKTSIKYDTDYSFDIAQSAIGYDPVYGSLGGVQVSVSDILGNKAFYFLLTNTAQTNDDLLDSFNFGVTYVNRENRLNWGLGAFHLVDEFFNDFDLFFTERQAGGILLFSYPISKFHRIDFTTVARYSKRERLLQRSTREAFLVTNYLSWVFDNSLWDYTGPIEGRRYNFSIGYTSSVSDRHSLRNFNRTVLADVRHYFRLGMKSAFASRLLGYTSTGIEPQRIYFGGSWSFRGFSRRAFYNRNIIFASHELRFPFVDNLLIGFPIGGLGFQGIRGALFFDAGSAWDDEYDELLGSFGAGFRVALARFILLRFDFSRTTDFEKISPNTDFDFFFGWNF